LDAARAATSATAWDAEQKWQTYRLIEWFSDNEPSDWPMANDFSTACDACFDDINEMEEDD
jgi:hypothetical protein